MWIFFLLNCSLKILTNKKNSSQKLVEEKSLSLETGKSVLNTAEKSGWQSKNNIFFNIVIHEKVLLLYSGLRKISQKELKIQNKMTQLMYTWIYGFEGRLYTNAHTNNDNNNTHIHTHI